MPQPRRSSVNSRRSISTVAISRLAKRQWGALSLPQLRQAGITEAATRRLVARGYLVRLYPAVYAVGHEPLRIEGHLLAALFHAGEGSALSHATAAWWWRLIDAIPAVIHISTPNRPSPAAGLKIHRPRQIEAVRERGLAVTTAERTLVDLASIGNERLLRHALAQADHRNLVNISPLAAKHRRGTPGARALRQALDHHLPQLATTDSELEVRFLLLLERAGLPIPETNAHVEGLRVDALFRDHKLIVELDGHATHANPPANETDRRRELKLRAAGYTVVRYTWQQVTQRPDEVVTDLLRLLAA